ncbi:MAG: amidohydrolase [Eubacteriales bacterium]
MNVNLIQQLQEYAVALRRELHQYPEVSLKEKETSARICRELNKMNIPYVIVGEYNVIAKITCGKGKKLALRADMDALEIEEQLQFPFQSRNKGIMHACGHDAHVAVLLATAKGLLAMKEELNGVYYLCFQQAEEVGQGARECVEYLQAQGGVDAAIALHMDAGLEVGKIDISEGARGSGCINFIIDIAGNGGHGARPDLSVDVIQVACEICTKIKQIPVYHHNPNHRCVINVCMLQAGTCSNVVPQNATIKGTMRFYKDGDDVVLTDQMKKMILPIGQSFGADIQIQMIESVKYPIVNDSTSIMIAHKVCKEIGLSMEPMDPMAGSDNFSEFLHNFSGCYGFIGAKSTRVGACESHHHPKFDIDEAALEKSILYHLAYVKEFSGQFLWCSHEN